jgi:hypothetical protein
VLYGCLHHIETGAEKSADTETERPPAVLWQIKYLQPHKEKEISPKPELLA